MNQHKPPVVEPAPNTTSTRSETTPTSGDEQRTAVGRLSASLGRVRSRATGGGEAEVDRVRFVQRVVRAFQSIGPDGGTLRLRFSPPSLGSAQLEVSVHADTITARIEVESTAARQLLIDNLPALRERLAQHDLKVVRFDIDLMGDRPGSSTGEPAHEQSQKSHRQGGAAPRTLAKDGTVIEPSIASRPRRSDTALDLLA